MQPGDDPAPDDGDAILENLAAQLEKRFRHAKETLTDKQTARVFQLSLTVVKGFLDGAHAQDIIDAGQHEELTEMMHGLRAAADRV